MNAELFFLETEDCFPQDKLAHELIVERARRHPERVALAEGERQITYGELERLTGALAARLLADGIREDDAVGVYIDRSINYVIGLLAAVRSGGCYVPIDPDIPAERLAFIVRDAGCKRMLSEAQYAGRLDEFKDKTIFLDRLDFSALPPLSAPPRVKPSALAYIIYTSGSTGTPKGVEIEHSSLLNLVQWHHHTFIEPDFYRVSQSSGPGFDASVREIWAHLTNGATMLLMPEILRLQPQQLVDWLTANEINECSLSTPVAELALSADWRNNATLKYLQCGGEKLGRKPGADFPAVLANLYGPTECAVDSSWAMFKAGEDDGQPPHIGVPVSNFRIYVLDENLNPAPRGAVGEICIAGAGLARGYRNLPELTAAAFVPDPFRPGKRIYRSGDLGRINADGRLECLGRKDFQVKIRGYRIELGEIEAALARHPEVTKCVVMAREKGGVKYLAAYLMLKTAREQRELSDELRAWLGRGLPEYMLPAVYMTLPELPLTLNGKVDRRALPEPDFAREEIAPSEAADPLLNSLAGIWRRLLKLDRVGPDDNFFLLGGHSLLATALCLEMEKQLLATAPISQVFANPTLRQLTLAVRNCAGVSRTAIRFGKVKPAKNNLYPASVAQSAMWFIEKSSEHGNTFNIPFEIYLRGEVDPELVEAAFNLVVQQNDSLRTSFEFINEELYLKINPFRRTEILFQDLAMLPEEERQRRYQAEIGIQRFQVFDFARPPLFSCVLLKLQADDFRLVFTVHHLIFDGWSTFLFFKQFAEGYRLLEQGQPPAIAAPRWQYVDFCRWQTDFLKTYAPQAQLKYWRRKLDGLAPTPPLPVQKLLPGKGQSRRYYVKINPEITLGLNQLATDNNASLFMVLTALLQLLIHKYTGATDITTGATIANRNLPETEEIIGLFINALALRNEIRVGMSFREFLAQVKGTLLEAYENQDIPYSMILKQCGGAASGGKKSLFKVSMLLQNLPWPDTDSPTLKMWYEELGSDVAKMDLIITLKERDGMIQGWYEYDTARFEEKEIETFFRRYLYLAETLIGNANATIAEIQWPLTARRRPGCYLIGETALSKAAGEILLKNGFYVHGVFTEDARTLAWAAEHEIPRHPPRRNLIAELTASVRPDYLFSIINGCILDAGILASPLKLAINYHDSPLPRYAGLYSTAWAIINQEPAHGVTWHQMTAEIDAGDILRQRAVAVSPYDTSVSLNLKCTREALDAFESLVHDLKDGTVAPIAQDLTRRTYNSQAQRPPDACVINFSQRIEQISALARALEFGDYDNPLGTLKFAIGDRLFMVKELSVSGRKSLAAAGTVIEADGGSEFIVVAVGDGSVKLAGISDLEGHPVPVVSLGLAAGQPLAEKLDRELLDRWYKAVAADEMFWTKRLSSVQLPAVPMLDGEDESNLELPQVAALEPVPGGPPPELAFALFLSRISGTEEFDLPLAAGWPPARDFPALFAEIAPWRLKLNLTAPASTSLAAAGKSLNAMRDRNTFCRDIFLRYRKLRRFDRAPYALRLTEQGGCELLLFHPRGGLLLDCFKHFYANLTTAPEARPRDISILSEAERRRALYEWNATARDFDLSTPYIRQFEKTVAQYPDKPAVKSATGALTYRELDCRAEALARRLLALKPGGGQVIGVLTDKTLEMAVAILAVFKAGGAYLPLDVQRQPPERIEAMIFDSGAEIIISALRTPQRCHDHLPDYVKVIDASAAAGPADGPLRVKALADDTAYIMYTSGSTGVPKGVMVSQANLLNHNYAVIREYGLTADDNVLQFSTLGFDISIEEIFPCWLTGGTLVFMPEGLLEAPLELFKFISRENISFLDLPTSYWHELAALVRGPEIPDCMRLIVIGGEKASPERFGRWRRYVPGVRVLNTYGPTETTVIASLGDNPETIGKPLPNMQLYVLDSLLQPLPAGVEGELYIAGAGVAKGYLNKPAETAAAFMTNPFVPGGRMYKTGDKAKWNPDGEMVFAGRADEQFKIRGFRIEPDEIESVLCRHPDVRSAVVKLWINDKTGLKSLAAYFVPAAKTCHLDGIREFVKSQLPEYMAPAYYTAVDSMPLTPNGKINRKALPPPAMELVAPSAGNARLPVEPSTPLEMQIRLAFAKILGRNDFDGDANFMESELDSLSAIKLMMEIENQTGAKIPVEKLYQSMSVNDICNYIRNSGGASADWNAFVKLAGGEDKPPLFLLHTTPGDVFGYVNLVHHLDDRPVYGIQSPGLKSPENAHHTIEAMAAYYAAKVIELCPDGPYFLCGWCFGGYVAYEMAQQLRAMGRQVAFVGLIETYARLQPSLFNHWQRICGLAQWRLADYVEYLRIKLTRRFGGDRNLERLDFISERFANASSEGEIASMKTVYRRNMAAAGNYFMRYYDGRLSLFMARATMKGKIPLPDYGWKHLGREIDLHIFESSHADILREPHAALVAKKIVQCMNAAQPPAC